MGLSSSSSNTNSVWNLLGPHSGRAAWTAAKVLALISIDHGGSAMRHWNKLAFQSRITKTTVERQLGRFGFSFTGRHKDKEKPYSAHALGYT
jgi:hypothetical protein